MLRDTLFIAVNDLKRVIRARETIVWVFLMPPIFFFFIGSITGGSGMSSSPDRKDPIAMWVDPTSGFLVDQLEVRLKDQNYETVRVDSLPQLERYGLGIRVPASFTDSVLAGVATPLEFRNPASGLNQRYHAIRVQRAVYTVVADLAVLRASGTTPAPEDFVRLNAMPRALTLDVKPAGELKQHPGGYQHAIPGIMVMFTLMVMATSGSVLVVIERKEGLLRRLASTPISRLSIVLGKWGGKWLVGLVQIAFAMLAGTLLFRMNWGPQLGAVVGVMLVYAALMAVFGMILGSLARSEGQAIGIGVASANVLAALGGCWWPIEITPPWMQKLQLFLPTGWAMDAMHKLVSFGDGPASVAPHVVGMFLGTIVMMGVARRVFRFD